MRWLFALAICLATPAWSEEVVLGLSKDRIAITTGFDGSEILVFGAVRREKPINEETPLEVIITVAGPSQPVEVRRKSNELGIWVNTDRVEVDLAPVFYAVATTGPLAKVLSDTEDLRHKITVDRAIRSVGAPQTILDSAAFTDALIRIRRAQELYQQLEGEVLLDQQTLFRAAITMPAQLTEGDYAIRIFLTRHGLVMSKLETSINVRKEGLGRFLFTLSRQQPAVYGVMALLIAAFAGWIASAAFRMLRHS